MSPGKLRHTLHSVTVRLAGDSGDGMQVSGDQFADTSAIMGNDFSTFPDFPAEIRAPAGTLPGVSSFQIQLADSLIFTPGDQADVLIALNPAALKVNLPHIKPGGLILVNSDAFDRDSLERASWTKDPLSDQTLKDFSVIKVPILTLTQNALKDRSLKNSEVERCKNFFALGMAFWLYDRQMDHTIDWIQKKYARRPDLVDANISVLKAGYHYADITEALPAQYAVHKAALTPGTYRKINGNEALALGLITAAQQAQTPLFFASYPITPASSILQDLSLRKEFGVKTFQAEDEIAAMGAVVGAAFGGALAVTATSGPGLCLKSEALNLAVMTELPVVVIDVQRVGPSTGMPTKSEQTDLLQALFGRNGESPVIVLAPQTPSDCFAIALEAVKLAVTHMSPVMILSDGYLSSSAEPWKLPGLDELPSITVRHAAAGPDPFLPYARDPATLARPWAVPGTPGLEHRIGGLNKADRTGNVSYDPDNHEKMVALRAEKVQRAARSFPPLRVQGTTEGDLLVVGWGSTFGALHQAVTHWQERGRRVSHVHLRHLNPLPLDLGDLLKHFRRVWVPELNSGQLLMLLRHHYPSIMFTGYHRVRGVPFLVGDLVEALGKALQ